MTEITITRELATEIKNQFGLTTEAAEFFGLTFEDCRTKCGTNGMCVGATGEPSLKRSFFEQSTEVP